MAPPDDRLASLLADVREQLARGESPDVDVLCEQHPDLADELRAQVEAMELLGEVADESSVAPLEPDQEAGPLRARLHPLRADRYVDFKPAGEGGMGLVYWALDTDLNRQVAFKVVRPDAADQSGSRDVPQQPLDLSPPGKDTPASKAFETLKARFLQEAWVTGGLEHPGIVPVYELGETDQGVPYYTMRFVRGERTLADAIEEMKGAQFEERLAMLEPFLRVCDTIQYAHAQGVIHRDLKPVNIALGSYGEVVVLDWGLSKLQGQPDQAGEAWHEQVELFRKAENLQTVAAAMGTPGYMSPEAATGRVDEVDARSDVYSLGAMLFEILTGRLPHLFQTYGELLQALMNEEAPSLQAVEPSVPASLATVVEAALAPTADDRPGSVAELAGELRAWQTLRSRQLDAQRFCDEATAVFRGAQSLEGHALLVQMDTVLAALARALRAEPDNAEAATLQAEARGLRAEAIQAQASEQRRRALKRASLIGAVALAVLTTVFAVVFRGERDRATDAERLARSRGEESERAKQAYRAQALAGLSREEGAAAPGRGLLLAAEALMAVPPDEEVPLDVWHAVQVAVDRAPTGHPMGVQPDVLFSASGATCFALDRAARRLRVFVLEGGEGVARDVDVETPREVESWAASPSGRSVILVDGSGRAFVLTAADDEPTLIAQTVSGVTVACVADDAWFGVLADGRLVRRSLEGEASPLELGRVPDAQALGVDAEGTHVAVLSSDAVRVWRRSAGSTDWEALAAASKPALLPRRRTQKVGLAFRGAVVEARAERATYVLDVVGDNPDWIRESLPATERGVLFHAERTGAFCAAVSPESKKLVVCDVGRGRGYELEASGRIASLEVGGGAWLVARLTAGGLDTWNLLAADVAASRKSLSEVEPKSDLAFCHHDTGSLVTLGEEGKRRRPILHRLDMRSGASSRIDLSQPVPLLAGEDVSDLRVRLGEFLSLSSAGDYAVFGTSRDGPIGGICILDLRPGEDEPACLQIPAHDFETPEVTEVGPDGLWMVTCRWNVAEESRLWHLPGLLPQRDIAVRAGAEGAADPAAFSPDGKWLAWFSTAREISIGRFEGTCVHRVEVRFAVEVQEPWSLAFTGDGRHLYVCAEDGIQGWQVFPKVEALPFLRRDAQVHVPSVDGGFRRIVTGEEEPERLQLHEREPGGDWRPGRTVAEGGFYEVALSADGSVIAAASSEGRLHVWRVPDEETQPVVALEPVMPSAQEDGHVNELALAPDGRFVAVRYDCEGFFLYRIEGTHLEPVRLVPGLVGDTVQFDVSGRWLAIHHYDHVLRYDLEEAQRSSILRPVQPELRTYHRDGLLHPAGDRVLVDLEEGLGVVRTRRTRRRASARAAPTTTTQFEHGLVQGRWLCLCQGGVDTTTVYDLDSPAPGASERRLPQAFIPGVVGPQFPARAVLMGSTASVVRWDPSQPDETAFELLWLFRDNIGGVEASVVVRGRWLFARPIFLPRGPLIIWDLAARPAHRHAAIGGSFDRNPYVSGDGQAVVCLLEEYEDPRLELWRFSGEVPVDDWAKAIDPKKSTSIRLLERRPEPSEKSRFRTVWRPPFAMNNAGTWAASVLDGRLIGFDLRAADPTVPIPLDTLPDEYVICLEPLPAAGRDVVLCVSVEKKTDALISRLIGSAPGSGEPVVLERRTDMLQDDVAPESETVRPTQGGLCASNEDGERFLWSLSKSGKLELQVLERHLAAELSASDWSRSRRWSVFGDADGGLQVHDGRPGRIGRTGLRLDAHAERVLNVWIDGQERWLASRSDDGLLKFWPLRRDDMLALLLRLSSRDFTSAEWATFMGADKRRSTRAALAATLKNRKER